MLVTLSGMVMLVKPVQPEKAQSPMLVTLLPIVTLVNLVQPEKALSPMLVTLTGIVTLVNPVQPEKVSLPMLVTLSEMVMLVNPVQPEKAPLSICSPVIFTEFREEEMERLRQTEQQEDLYTQMWKEFFNTIAVEKRKNPVCQRNMFPLRYRKHVTEFL